MWATHVLSRLPQRIEAGFAPTVQTNRRFARPDGRSISSHCAPATDKRYTGEVDARASNMNVAFFGNADGQLYDHDDQTVCGPLRIGV